MSLDLSYHKRARYHAKELRAIRDKTSPQAPNGMAHDLPRGHALRELLSKYNQRRFNPGR